MMSRTPDRRVESEAAHDFAEIMQGDDFPLHIPPGGMRNRPRRMDIQPDSIGNGLGQLVLTLVKLLHELLERQAIRRIDGGSLSDGEIEKLGVTLMRQAEEIDRLRSIFGLREEDLNLDLGPLGKLL